MKRFIRKQSPATVPELIKRLREASDKVTGKMIKGWYLKSGYIIPGEEPQVRAADPNAGVTDRCTLPADARFQRREHIACYDDQGRLRREKPQGKTKWSKYDEDDEMQLKNISVTKRSAIPPRTRPKITACAPPEEGKARSLFD